MKRLLILLLVFVSVFLFPFKTFAVDCSAVSAVIINCDTGSVLFEKNADVKLPMASTTKIMTAILLIERNTPKRKVTVNEKMITVEGSSMGLVSGDVLTYNDLLYGLMLPSGNDAANTVAISVAGSTEKFAELMNKKAEELGLKNTRFVTPSGLDGVGHGTTAKELAKITRYAMQYESFRKVVATKTKTLTLKNGRIIYLKNHNKLLNSYDGAIGVKTGYTSSAGRCLVSAAKRDGTTLICVTLNDKNDWKDHTELLNYGFSLCENKKIETEIPKRIFTADGKKNAELKLEDEFLSVCEKDKISFEICLPKFLMHSINNGEQVGEVRVFANNSYVKSVPIIAQNEVKMTAENGLINRIFLKFLMIFRSI